MILIFYLLCQILQLKWRSHANAKIALITARIIASLKYNYIIKLCRKKDYHDKLTSVHLSLTQTWSIIKSVVTSKSHYSGPFTNMKDNRGNIINNPQTTASEVNEFFTNIVPSLAAIIPHVSVDHKSYSEWFFCGLFLHLTYYS